MSSRPPILTVGLPAGFGAGVAAALLSAMPALKGGFATAGGGVSSAGAAAWLFAAVAPLPIMLAALSFGTLSGLLAALVGALAVGGLVVVRPEMLAALQLDRLVAAPLVAVVFAISSGIPSWLLARLAVVASAPRRIEGKLVPRPEEQRLGNVMAVAAGFAAIGAAIAIGITALASGSFHTFLEAGATALEPAVTRRGPLPNGIDAHALARLLVWWLLASIAAGQLLALSVNLWLAARIAQLSGLLQVPWPDVPASLRMPRPLAVALAVALGLSSAGNQLGALGVAGAGALGMGFALQGLAVVHALTRGNPGLRLPLLTLLYFIFVALMPFSLVPFGLLGLLDAAFSFRDRQKPVVKKIQ